MSQPIQVDYTNNVNIYPELLGIGTLLLNTDADFGSGAGLTVTQFSLDGGLFQAVPADSSPSGPPGLTLTDSLLSITVDSDGSIGFTLVASAATLINAINANQGPGPLSAVVSYQVTDGSTTVTDTDTIGLNDISFSAPLEATAVVGQTVGVSGLAVSVASSTDSHGNVLIGPEPTLTVTVDDAFGDGTLGGLSSRTAAGTSTITADSSGYIITGTATDINADLKNLTFTGTQQGNDTLSVTATQYASDGHTVLQQTGTYFEGSFSVSDTVIPTPNYLTNVAITPGFGGEGTALLGTDASEGVTNLPVTEISVNGGSLVAVPAGSSPSSGIDGATVTGQYFTITADADGSIGIAPAQNSQALIDAINNNTTGAALGDDLTYEVQAPDGPYTMTVGIDLTDIGFSTAAGSPLAATATVGSGQTVALNGLSVAVPASTDGSGANPVLSVVLSLYSDGNSLDQGALGFSQAAQGSSTITPGAISTGVTSGTAYASFTLIGTVQDINSDLANLTFTSAAQGTNYLAINAVQSDALGAILQQTDPYIEGTIQITAACFCVGTRIRTDRGDVAIEALVPGDAVVLARAGGEPTRRVTWTGHRRIDCARHPNPQAVWPVQIRRGAFAEAQPACDLWVSPGHSVYVEGILTQIENLINGVTIRQVSCDQVEYWHVELENHDILFAEGLPTESYLDTGNRTAFVGGGDYLELHPDFRPKHWSESCVPLVAQGPEVVRAREALLSRALVLGYRITTDDDLHVLADGQRLDPVRLTSTRVAFLMPEGCQDIRLQSRTFIPSYLIADNLDGRTLGVCVGRLQIDGREVALDDPAAFAPGGWHGVECYREHRQRWTTGCTPLAAGVRLLVLDLMSTGRYWDETAEPPLRAVAAA